MLLFLIGLVACRATRMELIDSYLNQMMARVGHSVNYALDKAFADSVDEWDRNFFKLKMQVIDQAQAMFRPLAKSVLIESLSPRLNKRGNLFSDDERYRKTSPSSWFHEHFVSGLPNHDTSSSDRYYLDFDPPNGRIPYASDGFHSLEHDHLEFQNTHLEFQNRFIKSKAQGFSSSLFADNPLHFGDPSKDYPPDPLYNPHSYTDLPHNTPVLEHSSASSHGKSFQDLLRYDPSNYRPDWWSPTDRYPPEWYHPEWLTLEDTSKRGLLSRLNGAFSPGKSWNMMLVKRVKQLFSLMGRAWRSVVVKLNLENISDSFGDRFSSIICSETAHKAGLVVIGMSIGYLVYSLFLKKDYVEDHEYFE